MTDDDGTRLGRRGAVIFVENAPFWGQGTGKIKGSRQGNEAFAWVPLSRDVWEGKAARRDWPEGGAPSLTGSESPLTC